MGEAIPVTPEILTWARSTIGLSIEQVASKMGKTKDVIEQWENGSKSPTYVQLKRLAHEIYKRPIALFFFPEPPEEDGIEKSFRTLPQAELDSIPSRIRYLLRQAKIQQFNLEELYQGTPPAESFILRDFDFSTHANIKDEYFIRETASRLRNYLGTSIAQQQELKEEYRGNDTRDRMLKYWRDLLLKKGIFIFKENFRGSKIKGISKFKRPENNYCGFCLYDDKFPVIYLNNNNSKNRQIFTIFHELAHLLMESGGIDKKNDDEYIKEIDGEDKDIEIFCNKFAAEFLVPIEGVQDKLKELNFTDNNLQKIANYYTVSKEVIFRRCLDMGLINSDEYQERKDEWNKKFIDSMETINDSGGEYYNTKITYFGEYYVERVLYLYNNEQINDMQAANFLQTDVSKLAKFEAKAEKFGAY